MQVISNYRKRDRRTLHDVRHGGGPQGWGAQWFGCRAFIAPEGAFFGSIVCKERMTAGMFS
jgi:hypothetical protein